MDMTTQTLTPTYTTLCPIPTIENKISVIEGRTEYFGNITVMLHSLGSSAYRIEWISRMTGASTSISRLMKDKYLVMKKWSSNKGLPSVSSEFDNRKSALIHFLNNVDIIKTDPETIYDAKEFCLNIYAQIEKIKPIISPKFPKLRLQGAIGRTVEIKNHSGKEVLAEGTLLQLIGKSAEVRIDKRSCLIKPQKIQEFSVERVFIK